MTRLSSTEAEGETQVENGLVDEKEPLKNGIADKTQMVEDADRTDDVPRTEEDNKPLSSLFKKSTKRKYKTYDNGKRSRINLAPLTAGSIRIEKTIKEKTGLTRTGLVLAILCVLLTIALVVCFFLWPKMAYSKSVCNKASCLRSSAEVTYIIDFMVFLIIRFPPPPLCAPPSVLDSVGTTYSYTAVWSWIRMSLTVSGELDFGF